MRVLASVAVVLTVTAAGLGQVDRREITLFTRPVLPDREVLERLNLRQSWSTFVPSDGVRDGILSLQVAPLWRGKSYAQQLIVQTRSGSLSLLDAETGQRLWHVRVGEPYRGVEQPAGFSNTYVVVGRGTDLYGLLRESGEIAWRINMGGVLASAPLVDARQVYVNLGAAVAYYELPGPTNPQPRYINNYASPETLALQPAQTSQFLLYPSPKNGSVSVLFKDVVGRFLTFRTEGRLYGGPGVHESDQAAYVGSTDTNLYAGTMGTGESFRFATGGAILRAPFVNDDDVYVVSQSRGLHRVRRRSLDGKQVAAILRDRGMVTPAALEDVTKALGGKVDDARALVALLRRRGYLTAEQETSLHWRAGEPVWLNREGDRVLAVNPKFVYATDSSSRFMILARENGRRLSLYPPFRDFVVPVTNEVTDRVFLAANNGLVVCLHDRDFAVPRVMKTLPESGSQVPPKNGKEPPRPMPPKEDDKGE